MANNKTTEDDLAQVIVDTLNKKNIPSYIIGQEETPTDLKDFIGTGSSILDLAVSNRKNGGMPCGRIIELNGLEGSGKSLIAAHMMANVQKEGGIAVLFDTETALNEDFYKSVGIDMNRLVYAHTEVLEDIFDGMMNVIEKIKMGNEKSKKKKVLIVLDSLAGASTKKELEGEFEREGYGTDKSQLISRALRKITGTIARERICLVITNQLRQKLGAMAFADQWISPGGKALPFHASVRVRLNMVGQIKNSDKSVVGVSITAKVIKNRCGPPYRTANFDIYFNRGIDDISSILKFLKDHEIVEGGAAGRFSYKAKNGEEYKFQTSTWNDFVKQNSDIFDELNDRISESMIMAYQSDGLSTLDGSAEISNEGTDE